MNWLRIRAGPTVYDGVGLSVSKRLWGKTLLFTLMYRNTCVELYVFFAARPTMTFILFINYKGSKAERFSFYYVLHDFRLMTEH